MQDTSVDILDYGNLKILLVDDFVPTLTTTAVMLNKYKIKVNCVQNGKEAVLRIQKGEPPYDFILMDYMMPDMDGIETTRQIRALDTEYAKNIPIIALTGNDDPGSESMFLDNGFQLVLYKPISLDKLNVFLKEMTDQMGK
jgi:CheY-like chemotaxis protein